MKREKEHNCVFPTIYKIWVLSNATGVQWGQVILYIWGWNGPKINPVKRICENVRVMMAKVLKVKRPKQCGMDL